MTIAVTRSGEPETKPSGTCRCRQARGGPCRARAGTGPDGTVRYVRIGDLQLESGVTLPDVILAYRDVGDPQRRRLQRRPDRTCADGRHPRDPRRQRGTGLVGAAGRSRRPRGHGQVLRRLDQHPGRLLRAPRAPPRRPRTAGRGVRGSRSSPCGTPPRPRRGWPTPWASAAGTPCLAARWAVRAPWSGPSRYPERVRRCAVISVGASSTAEQIAFAQAQTLAIRQDPHFNGGDYYGGPEPEAAWPWPAGSRTSPTAPRQSWMAGSAGTPRIRGAAGRPVAGRPRPLSGGKLPGPPGQQAGPALRCQQLHRHHRGADEPRHLPRPRNACGSPWPGPPPTSWWRPWTRTGCTSRPSPGQLAEALPGGRGLHIIEAPIGHDGFLTEIGQLSSQLAENFFG